MESDAQSDGIGIAELPLDQESSSVARSDELVSRMRAHFCAPEYALFLEVMATTGARANRRTDAVAISLYPSRGLMVHGFELKVSRSDWLREMKDTTKAEEIFGFCDHWWLVVGDASIVKNGELPEPWGLIVPRGDGLYVKKKAPKLDPKPLTRGFFAALARRANESASEAIEDRVRLATAKIREDAARDLARVRDDKNSRSAELFKRVREFEQASGIDISRGWHGGAKIGEAVKLILDGGLERQAESARHALRIIDGCQKGLHALVTAFPKDAE